MHSRKSPKSSITDFISGKVKAEDISDHFQPKRKIETKKDVRVQMHAAVPKDVPEPMRRSNKFVYDNSKRKPIQKRPTIADYVSGRAKPEDLIHPSKLNVLTEERKQQIRLNILRAERNHQMNQYFTNKEQERRLKANEKRQMEEREAELLRLEIIKKQEAAMEATKLAKEEEEKKDRLKANEKRQMEEREAELLRLEIIKKHEAAMEAAKLAKEEEEKEAELVRANHESTPIVDEIPIIQTPPVEQPKNTTVNINILCAPSGNNLGNALSSIMGATFGNTGNRGSNRTRYLEHPSVTIKDLEYCNQEKALQWVGDEPTVEDVDDDSSIVGSEDNMWVSRAGNRSEQSIRPQDCTDVIHDNQTMNPLRSLAWKNCEGVENTNRCIEHNSNQPSRSGENFLSCLNLGRSGTTIDTVNVNIAANIMDDRPFINTSNNHRPEIGTCESFIMNYGMQCGSSVPMNLSTQSQSIDVIELNPSSTTIVKQLESLNTTLDDQNVMMSDLKGMLKNEVELVRSDINDIRVLYKESQNAQKTMKDQYDGSIQTIKSLLMILSAKIDILKISIDHNKDKNRFFQAFETF